jgi:four helix bundle protein
LADGDRDEARTVTLEVLRLSRVHWQPHASAAFNQLQRASLSVQLNIAEGYTFGNSPTFTRHLTIAFGSAVETVELLELLVEAEVVQREVVSDLLRHSVSSRKLLAGMLKQRRNYGEGGREKREDVQKGEGRRENKP